MVWGLPSGVTGQQLSLCADFATFLRSNAMVSVRTEALARDVDSTIVAVQVNSPARYAAACNAYVAHEAGITSAERDSIAAWRMRNNPWAKTVTGSYVAKSGAEVALEVNVPNPLRERTTVTYSLPEGAMVRVAVYDNAGDLITTLEAGQQNAGRYSIQWDARDDRGRSVPSGAYFLRLTTPGILRVQTMRVVR